VADVFLARLREKLPDAAGRIEARIRDLRTGGSMTRASDNRMEAGGEYWAGIERLFEIAALRVRAGPAASWCDGAASVDATRPRQLPLF